MLRKVTDYANRFDRSAPAWFSIPMKLRQSQAQASDSSFDLDAAWEAPESLSAADVATLERTLERTAQPWCLGWGRLKFIETAALADLLRVFSRWTNESVRLRYLDCVQLHVDLRDHFAGARSEEPKGTTVLSGLMPGSVTGNDASVTKK